MTKLERQLAAISMAVRKATYAVGENAIRREEFFGMKQEKRLQETSKAA